MNTVAVTRGVTSFFMGSVPSARMASICSVTTIEPSSLAMPEELRPATIRPVSTGPSSRTMEVETSCPISVMEPKRCRVLARLQRQHAAGEEAGEHDDGQRAHADQVGLLHHVREIKRLAEKIAHRLRSEQGVFLNRQDFFLGEFRGRDQFHAIREPGSSCMPVCRA